MKIYHVEYELEGEVQTETMEGVDPGNAFVKVLRKFPGAKLIRCLTRGPLAGKPNLPTMQLTYDPPSVVKVEPLPKENLKQTNMPFLDELPRQEKC